MSEKNFEASRETFAPRESNSDARLGSRFTKRVDAKVKRLDGRSQVQRGLNAYLYGDEGDEDWKVWNLRLGSISPTSKKEIKMKNISILIELLQRDDVWMFLYLASKFVGLTWERRKKLTSFESRV